VNNIFILKYDNTSFRFKIIDVLKMGLDQLHHNVVSLPGTSYVSYLSISTFYTYIISLYCGVAYPSAIKALFCNLNCCTLGLIPLCSVI